jgi:hypothetical protein
MIKVEARACVRKYFIVASFLILFFGFARIGMKAKVFVSRPNQAISQDDEEIVVTMARIIVVRNIMCGGLFFGL